MCRFEGLHASRDAFLDTICRAKGLEDADYTPNGNFSLDPAQIKEGELKDSGAALFSFLADVQQIQVDIQARAADLEVREKNFDEFTFGDTKVYGGGLQEIIGMPVGVDLGWPKHNYTMTLSSYVL